MTELASGALTLAGVVFYLAGTLGLIRFPDPHSRLHALTKADNLGLGLVALGLSFHAVDWMQVLKLVLIWGLAILAAGTAAQLMARVALPEGMARADGNEA